jgi:isoaspartyl peptidase/L-asparaginase-like protein (Ntn-hydrolase superfamily)
MSLRDLAPTAGRAPGPALLVHGGCGGSPRESDREASVRACERAADEGWAVLAHGGSALEAVETATCRLEDEPALNAGTGSYLQADGVARMDASVMTDDGRAGSVAQVPGLRNPVRLARYLLEHNAHVMLAGPEALQLALRLGHVPAVVATAAKVGYWLERLDEPTRRLDYASMARAWRSRRHGAMLPWPRRRHAHPRRGHLLYAQRRGFHDGRRRAHHGAAVV